ncbi:MAG: sulfatase-like hydrolase/transferase [Planctomycetota bacterium]
MRPNPSSRCSAAQLVRSSVQRRAHAWAHDAALGVYALALCALAASCSRHGDTPGSSGHGAAWERITWAPDGQRPDLSARVMAALTPQDVVDTWSVSREGRKPMALEVAGTPARLELRATGARLAKLTLDIEAARVDAATLTIDVPEGEKEGVMLSFVTGPRTRAYSDVKVVEGGPGLESVSFELGMVQRLEGRVDHVVLHAAGQCSAAGFVALDLTARPPLALLPDVREGPRQVHVGTDGRAAIGLAGNAPVTGHVAAPRDGELHLSYRVGPGPELADAVLVLEGLGSDALRLPLAADASAWRELVRSVKGPGDLLLRARIEASDPTAASLLADAGVLDRAARRGSTTPSTVVLITSDTHRGELLSAASPSLVATPALDALAARGVLFLDAASTTNATNPSHVALMTGIHPRDTRVVTNRAPVARQATTLAERFAAAGWRTAASFSAFQLGDELSGLGQGFDRYDGPGFPRNEDFDAFEGSSDTVRLGEHTVAAALAQIAAVGDAPLFLWVHVYDPHSPYVPPPAFDGKYYPAGQDPRATGAGLPVSGADVPSFLTGVTDPDYAWDQYRALVDYVDHALAPLLTTPRVAAGITAFTSDHGESFGNHGIWWDHTGIYRDTTIVPLVLAWPGAPAARVKFPVEQFHIGRTLLALAGLEPGDFPGRDLRDALAIEPAREPRFALAANGVSASVDDGRWLLVMHLTDEESTDKARTWTPGQVELFDRIADPDCSVDRVSEELVRARRMRKALVAWLDAADQRGLAESFHISAAIDAALQELGYADTEVSGSRWFDPASGDSFTEAYGEK